MIKFLVPMMFSLVLISCATGEKFSSVDEGMTKEQVRATLGKEDQIERLDNGGTVLYYRNRLMSGFSWDKTDYFAVLDPNGKVFSYGHGAVDSRTSERMAAWGAQQQTINAQNAQNAKANEKKSVTCNSSRLGNGITTTCAEN